MLKATGRAVLVLGLLLIVAVASPGVAREPGKKGTTQRADYCSDVYAGCLKVMCGDGDMLNAADLDWLLECSAKCQVQYGRCMDAERTIGPGFDNMLPGFSIGVLAEDGAALDVNDIDLSPITRPRLEAACTSVGGAFADVEPGNYGCVNRDCDSKGGHCVVICFGSKCMAMTPGKLAGNLTLIGILQNGDSVDRSKPELTPDSPDDDGGCGGKGCDIIF